MASCTFIAVSNISVNRQIFTYAIAIFCIASLILLKTYEINIIFISSYLIFIIGVNKTILNQYDHVDSILFLTIFIIMALIVSCIRYTTFKKSFIDKKIILIKNEELKELTALQQATFDNIPDCITVKNTRYEIISGNKAAYSLFNINNDKMTGLKCYERKGHSCVCENCLTREVLRIKQPAMLERYIALNDSWQESRAFPIMDDSGNVTKVIEHVRDITVKKQIDMELLRMNSILTAQLEASLEGILIVDKDIHVLGYNKKFTEIWNITDEAIKGKDGKDLFRYALQVVMDEEEFAHRMEELYRLPFESRYEKIRLKRGIVLDIFSAPILLSQAEVYGRVWYFRDITEKESMYEALRKVAEENEKLLAETMKYDELKSEFFANISHEFRTPINVLLGTLQLMNIYKANKYENQENDKTKKYFGIMKQNCFRLLRLTNNLIDMTRLDTGFFEINLQNHNIIQVVEDITLSVAAYIENKGISLVFDTDIEEKIIAVDADKIERIILNLLSNAVKFTKENGSIQVAIHNKGDSIDLSVKDTGIGIPETKLDIIFERFRQVNSSLSRDNEGSGIGLSLTKNLVELHGGTIKVTSEMNIGTEFIIELPCITIDEEMNHKHAIYNNQNYVERINIEFSDIYSI